MEPMIIPIKRGDIVRVQLDPVVGHEQAGVRPALVLSPEIINENLEVVMIASITSKRLQFVMPYEVLIPAGEGGLRSDSKVLLMQIRCIDQRRILSHFGSVSRETLQK